MTHTRLISIICAFICILAIDAKADIVNEFVQVQCMEEINTFRIDLFFSNGEIPRQAGMEDYKALWEKYGILLDDALIDYNEEFTRQHTRPIHTQCTLSEEGYEEKQTYHIELEPYVFRGNPNGQCGLARTFEISIKTKDRLLVDKVRFVEKCSWSAQLNTFMLVPHEGYMYFTGSFPDLDDDYHYYEKLHKNFSLNDEVPVTSDIIYTRDPE